LLDARSECEFYHDLVLPLLEQRIRCPKLLFNAFLGTDVSYDEQDVFVSVRSRMERPLKIAGIFSPFLLGR
jgi:hypothetical protein